MGRPKGSPNKTHLHKGLLLDDVLLLLLADIRRERNLEKQHKRNSIPSAKKKRSEYSRWSRVRNRQFIRYSKVASGCIKCGISDYRLLEYHHTDASTKSFTIGGAQGENVSLSSLKLEISKCVVLCKTCHIVEHHFSRLIKCL